MRALVRDSIERATEHISSLVEPDALARFGQGEYPELARAAIARGVRLRLITEITGRNSGLCRNLTSLPIEIRHLDSVRGNFSVTDGDYIRSSSSRPRSSEIPEIIHSNIPEIVDESQFMFDVLWEKGIPARIRFKQLQKQMQPGETRLTFSSREIFESANKFVKEMKDEALIFVPTEDGLKRNMEFFERVAAKAQAVSATARILARFSRDEIELVRRLHKKDVEVRRPASRERFKLAIGIYDRRGMGLIEQYPENPGSDSVEVALSGLISTDVQMVEWVAAVFDMFWENAVPLEDAIAQVESGIEPPRLRVFRDRSRVREVFLEQIDHSRSEILLLLPTTNAFHRLEKIGAIAAIEKALSHGARARVLTPVDPSVAKALSAMEDLSSIDGSPLRFRNISEAVIPNTVTILVIDRVASLVVEEKDQTQAEFESAIGDATFSTRNSTVLANIRFFERMWEEVELKSLLENALHREKKSRRTAELLQDILAHDIRNYNQISKLSAELLKSSLDGKVSRVEDALSAIESSRPASSDAEAGAERARTELDADLKALGDANGLIDSILKATEGSGKLTDKAKKLGRIMSQEELHLASVDLSEAIRNSMALMTAAHPEKSIAPSLVLKKDARVVADEMLEEVFTNVLSNSINHTEGKKVPLEVSVEAASLEDRPGRFWKVSISDHGSGSLTLSRANSSHDT